jgi:hypothetical protein
MKQPPLTSTVVAITSTVTLLIAAPACAEFGVGINISNIGFGVEARQTLSPSFDLRFGMAGLVYKIPFKYDGIKYDVEESTALPEIKLDWRPTQGIFRMTAGLGYYNQVSNLSLTPDLGANYTIGNNTYTSAQIGRLDGKVSYHVGVPYLGVGWDVVPIGKNAVFTVDAGAYYRNEPSVSLYSTGTVLASDLALEADNIKGDAWKIIPNVRLGILFRF